MVTTRFRTGKSPLDAVWEPNEVLEGISDGEVIVTEGQVRLKDGVKVTVEK